MPEAGDLGRFTRSLTARRLATITDDLHTRELELAMPKFSLSFRTALDGFLQSQGITRAFSGQSQLDRMIRGRTLAIDSVEQAAVLKVAETGTVAAAATGISVDPTAAPVDPISLRLDHPFLVFLRDTRSGTILFAARVENPSAS
jgi:serpin B